MADKKREKEKSLENAGLAGAQAETVQRYGSAVKEHFVSYSGMDNEAQAKLTKGLKQISESKVDPNNPEISIKQQAGFSAEVKTQARESAEKIIAGEKKRVTRTDDMTKQSDGRGHTIGGKNEQLYDIAEVDANGIYVEGTGRQLKFVGGNAKECCQKLLDKKFDKYRDAGVPIEIPSDFYDEVSADLSQRIDQLNKQIQNAEAKGNLALAEKHKKVVLTIAFLMGVAAVTLSPFRVGKSLLFTKSRSVSPVIALPDLSSAAQLFQRHSSGIIDV